MVPASDPRVINCVSVAARLPPGQQVLGTGARSSVAAIAWVRLGGESSQVMSPAKRGSVPRPPGQGARFLLSQNNNERKKIAN